jgi:hypothetical protein
MPPGWGPRPGLAGGPDNDLGGVAAAALARGLAPRLLDKPTRPQTARSLTLLSLFARRAPTASHRPAQEVLRDTTHNGFPVVRDTPSGQVFLGLISRPHLMVLLQRSISAQGGVGGVGGGDLQWGRAGRAAAATLDQEVGGGEGGRRAGAAPLHAS